MATPHLAGLMAYLLEIYGSESFPSLDSDALAELSVLGGADASEIAAIESVSFAQGEERTVYSGVYSALPEFVKSFLPSPRLISAFTAPAPKKPSVPALTPAQIKGLVVKLASKGILTDVKEGTPNLLAFNNATVVVKK